MRAIRLVATGLLLLAAFAPAAIAAEAPETPVRIPDQAVYDYADALATGTERGAEQIAGFVRDAVDGDLVVVTEVRPGSTAGETSARAGALLESLAVGEGTPAGGALVLVVVDEDRCHGQMEVAVTGSLTELLDGDVRSTIAEEAQAPLQACNVDAALTTAMGRLLTLAADGNGAGTPRPGTTAGPPFPEPVVDVAVYDHAGIFRPETIASAEATIDAIESRTGAEVVVYTQVVGFGGSEEQTESNARALMDQWGVGRRGFDDGLVILFDLDDTLVHGQVQLYAGPGYAAAFLSNGERDAIFENDMLPRLRAEDLDGALLAALAKIDANATPEHAATLQRARQVDAAVGLIGAPVVFLSVTGWAMLSWWRFGRDPVYLDDPSIHIPAPPPDLTAASAALILEGHSTRRALTTALLDLASRGLLSFREEKGFLGLNRKVGIETQPPAGDEMTQAYRTRNARRPISDAEAYALARLRSIGDDDGGYIGPGELLKFGTHVASFDGKLEAHVVSKGWFKEQPRKVTQRWGLRGGIVAALGGAGIWGGLQLPSNGLLLLGIGLLVAGIAILLLARSMPAVTMPGAMIRAMLAAYRRTLDKTMAQARSMQQVVDEARLDWLDTPDQAVVWGLALGLQDRVEAVLERSMDDLRDGVATSGTYVPAWYSSGSGGGDGPGGGGGGGLFSSSSIPNFGGMMGALGSIGNSPSSSGSGGGFGGGGSGGGGGGSGGGF